MGEVGCGVECVSVKGHTGNVRHDTLYRRQCHKRHIPVVEADERPALACPDNDAAHGTHLGEHLEKLVWC